MQKNYERGSLVVQVLGCLYKATPDTIVDGSRRTGYLAT